MILENMNLETHSSLKKLKLIGRPFRSTLHFAWLVTRMTGEEIIRAMQFFISRVTEICKLDSNNYFML